MMTLDQLHHFWQQQEQYELAALVQYVLATLVLYVLAALVQYVLAALEQLVLAALVYLYLELAALYVVLVALAWLERAPQY